MEGTIKVYDNGMILLADDTTQIAIYPHNVVALTKMSDGLSEVELSGGRHYYLDIPYEKLEPLIYSKESQVENEKLKKARKKAKRLKRKYLELRRDIPNILLDLRDFQINCLTSHADIEFSPEEERLIVDFLKQSYKAFIEDNTQWR